MHSKKYKLKSNYTLFLPIKLITTEKIINAIANEGMRK